MSSNFDVRDIDLKLKYNSKKKIWIGYSHYHEFYFKAESLDEVLNQIKLNFEQLKNSGKKRSLRELSKALVKSHFFINMGFYAIIKNWREDYYWFYLPHYVSSDLNSIELIKQQLHIDDVRRITKYLDKIEHVGIPESSEGLDGRMYCIRIGGGYNVIEYEWWSDSAGEKWTPLYEMRDLIIELKNKYKP